MLVIHAEIQAAALSVVVHGWNIHFSFYFHVWAGLDDGSGLTVPPLERYVRSTAPVVAVGIEVFRRHLWRRRERRKITVTVRTHSWQCPSEVRGIPRTGFYSKYGVHF